MPWQVHFRVDKCTTWYRTDIFRSKYILITFVTAVNLFLGQFLGQFRDLALSNEGAPTRSVHSGAGTQMPPGSSHTTFRWRPRSDPFRKCTASLNTISRLSRHHTINWGPATERFGTADSYKTIGCPTTQWNLLPLCNKGSFSQPTFCNTRIELPQGPCGYINNISPCCVYAYVISPCYRYISLWYRYS
jgi:hypothetical protein